MSMRCYRFFRRLQPMATALLLLVGLVACAPKAPLNPQAEVSNPNRENLSRTLSARSDEVKTFKSLARVVALERGTRSSLRSVLVFQHPASVRLELLPLNAAYTLELFVAQAGHSTLILPRERRAIVSDSHSGLLASGLKLPLLEEDLMSYLLARMPLRWAEQLRDPSLSRVTITEDGEIAGESREFGDAWRIDPESGLLKGARLLNRFDKLVDVNLEFFGSALVDGVLLPQRAVLELPRQELKLDFELRSSRVNQPVSADLFSIEIPPDYSVLKK